MPSVERRWTTDTGDDLLAMVRELCANELAPNAADAESASEFPREVFRTLGRSGLLGLPFFG